jgi:hypothetical protein
MTITAKVICDSIAEWGNSIAEWGIRLTTMQLRYPKFIHGEFMTHRKFSRNASSSRAIPVKRLIQDVISDPAIPIYWGKNMPGMQAIEEFTDNERDAMIEWWLELRDMAVKQASMMSRNGLHKQLVNRMIEPWCHINVVVTSTEWANFDALRCHPAAQPEMRALAEAMRDARKASNPRFLKPGEWHLPYVTDDELNALGGYTAGQPDHKDWLTFIKASVARCARVSYLTQEGRTPTFGEDLALYDRLVGSEPLHASPAEHQATPDTRMSDGFRTDLWRHQEQHANFVGWRQYRKMLPNEYVGDR